MAIHRAAASEHEVLQPHAVEDCATAGRTRVSRSQSGLGCRWEVRAAGRHTGSAPRAHVVAPLPIGWEWCDDGPLRPVVRCEQRRVARDVEREARGEIEGRSEPYAGGHHHLHTTSRRVHRPHRRVEGPRIVRVPVADGAERADVEHGVTRWGGHALVILAPQRAGETAQQWQHPRTCACCGVRHRAPTSKLA